nr:FAD-dependent oxidoreductase [Halomonas socia]
MTPTPQAPTHGGTGHRDRVLVIGNGMAGQRLVEALLAKPTPPASITVIGAERVPAYNRILLSPLLAGELDHAALTLRDADWYAEQGVELLLGDRVERIERQTHQVITASGRKLGYDRLVLATGSRPAMPPVPGIDLQGVHGFRDLEDAATLTECAHDGGSAVVIGGGLLGLEAAEGLRKRGMAVSVLQRALRLMNRQLDATAAGLLEDELTGRGLTVITDARLAAVEDDGHGRVAAVRLEDGRRLATDCVVVAAGITPNAELGRDAGLDSDRAILVDAHLTTSDPAIHALGECCQFEQHTYGLVEPIWRQVEVLAAHLAGEAIGGYVEQPSATKLKISGVSLYAFGPIDPAPEHDVLSYHDPEKGDYRRLLLRDGRLEGVVLYGDTRIGPWAFDHALAGSDLRACRQALLFGPADVQALLDAAAEDADRAADSAHQERPVEEAA